MFCTAVRLPQAHSPVPHESAHLGNLACWGFLLFMARFEGVPDWARRLRQEWLRYSAPPVSQYATRWLYLQSPFQGLLNAVQLSGGCGGR